jgi:dihydrofolate synthase/folylpolyglutamate synthase
VLIFGALADKDFPAMLRTLRPHVDRVIYCPPPIRAAAPIAALRRAAPGTSARNVADAVARAKRMAGPNGEVIVAGSIYLVATARAHILGLRSDPLIRM